MSKAPLTLSKIYVSMSLKNEEIGYLIKNEIHRTSNYHTKINTKTIS